MLKRCADLCNLPVYGDCEQSPVNFICSEEIGGWFDFLKMNPTSHAINILRLSLFIITQTHIHIHEQSHTYIHIYAIYFKGFKMAARPKSHSAERHVVARLALGGPALTPLRATTGRP